MAQKLARCFLAIDRAVFMSTPTTDPQANSAPTAPPYEVLEDEVLSFGSFTLYPRRHQLFKNGQQVVLGSRALDLLIVLVTRAGELVAKEELIAYAWPRVIVEECNLRAQIVALRRLLNEDGIDCIATVPGCGYRFVLSPTRAHERAHPGAARTELSASNLPTLIRDTIGRDAVIERLCAQVATTALTTLVGPGGIGKTTLALEVGKRIESRFTRGARFVDLSDVNSPAKVQATLVDALGLPASDTQAWEQALAQLSEGSSLLVLDNCEHLLAAVREIIAILSLRAPNCRVLATSREPLLVEGEMLERVLPLALPHSAATEPGEIFQAPAVRLFIEHATAQDSSFVLHDEDAVAINQLCQCLDGVPLEIEIAAARVGSFGIQPLLSMLTGEFRLQMAGRRTAAKRHRSMRAVLDWSYVGLLPCEQALLRLASTFTGPFTLNAIAALGKGEALFNGQAPQRIVERLVAKSLLVAESADSDRYRLLGSTRLYAHGKLEQTGGTQRAVLRHAAYALDIVRKAAASNSDHFPEAWQVILGAESDTVRSALARACSVQGEQSPSLELKLLALGLSSKPRKKTAAFDDTTVYRLA